MEGYILLHKSILDNWTWGNQPKSKFEAWIYILLKANYEDRRVNIGFDVVDIKRGEFFTSQDQLSKDFRWSRGAVRRFLEMLQDDEMITIHAAKRWTKITVCKYESYNDCRPEKRPDRGQKSGHQVYQKPANINISESSDYEVKEPTSGQQTDIKTDTTNIYIYNTIVDIVGQLNQQTGKAFNPKSRKTQSLIKARLAEGWKLEDFKRVIETKSAKWLKDEKMADYLRPETLFGNKFEGYVNESKLSIVKPIIAVDHDEYIFGVTRKTN